MRFSIIDVKSYYVYEQLQYSNNLINYPPPATNPIHYYYPESSKTLNRTLYNTELTFYAVATRDREYSIDNKTYKLIFDVYINNIHIIDYTSSYFEYYSTDLNETIIVYSLNFTYSLLFNNSQIIIKITGQSFGLDYYYQLFYSITFYLKFNYIPTAYSLTDDIIQIVPPLSISLIFPFILKKYIINGGFSIGLLISTILLAISNMISLQYIILLTLNSIALIYTEIKWSSD